MIKKKTINSAEYKTSIIEPSIESLFPWVGSRYELVMVVSNRVRKLNTGADATIPYQGPANSYISLAAEELRRGNLVFSNKKVYGVK